MNPTPTLFPRPANIAVIIPAAGCGARTGLNRNKILAPLCGKPLLQWTLQALLTAFQAGSTPSLGKANIQLTQVFIAARREEFSVLENEVLAHFNSPFCVLIEGGKTRQQSVANAARQANADFLLVHDAARPLLSPNLIGRVTQAARETGAAIAALPASDTIKIARPKVNSQSRAQVGSTPDRSSIWLAQTPQVFRRDLFLEALQSAERDKFSGTDCASLVERIGAKVALIEGEAENFKITFAEDLMRAEVILKARQNELN